MAAQASASAKAEWFPIDALPPLAFDHADIMQDAIVRYLHE